MNFVKSYFDFLINKYVHLQLKQKAIRKLIFILISISLFSCEKTPSILLDINFEFSVYNSQNEDLLNPTITNHYDSTEIKLFYLESDGEIIEVFEPNLDYPRHFRIYKHENEYRISVSLNFSCIPDNSLTYIQWNKDDKDTIEAQFERSSGSVLMRKVWFNESEIWEWITNENAYYRIIKENP